MDLRINDRIILSPGRFYAIVAPVELFLAGLNDNPVIERYTTIFISGNFSRILNGINRTSGNFEVRRAFTVHQLLAILQEEYHSIIIVEHDPSLYEDAGEVKRVVPPDNEGCVTRFDIRSLCAENGSPFCISGTYSRPSHLLR